MTTETTRARIARLHGVAAFRIWLDARPGDENIANTFADAIEQRARESLSLPVLLVLHDLTDEEVVARVRPFLEPDIRRRLAEAGRLPS